MLGSDVGSVKLKVMNAYLCARSCQYAIVADNAYDMYLKPSTSCLCRKGHLDPDGHRNRTGRGDHNVRVCLVEIRFGSIVI